MCFNVFQQVLAIRQETATDERHVQQTDNGNRHTHDRQFEHAHRRQLFITDDAVGHHVGAGTDQRTDAPQDRSIRQRNQEARWRKPQPFGHLDERRHQEGDQRRIVHEGRQSRHRRHQSQQTGVLSRFAEHPAADDLDGAGRLQSGPDNIQGRNHNHARIGKSFQCRLQIDDTERDQNHHSGQHHDLRTDALLKQRNDDGHEDGKRDVHLGDFRKFDKHEVSDDAFGNELFRISNTRQRVLSPESD